MSEDAAGIPLGAPRALEKPVGVRVFAYVNSEVRGEPCGFRLNPSLLLIVKGRRGDAPLQEDPRMALQGKEETAPQPQLAAREKVRSCLYMLSMPFFHGVPSEDSAPGFLLKSSHSLSPQAQDEPRPGRLVSPEPHKGLGLPMPFTGSCCHRSFLDYSNPFPSYLLTSSWGLSDKPIPALSPVADTRHGLSSPDFLWSPLAGSMHSQQRVGDACPLLGGPLEMEKRQDCKERPAPEDAVPLDDRDDVLIHLPTRAPHIGPWLGLQRRQGSEGGLRIPSSRLAQVSPDKPSAGGHTLV